MSIDTSRLRFFGRALGQVSGITVEANKRVAKKVAERFLAKLKSNWEDQKLNLAPLSAAYKAAKQQEGLDDRILIATKKLFSSLAVFESGGFVVAGVQHGTSVEGANIDLTELMAAIEFGVPSANIPARPIFRLTLISLLSELKALVKEETRREFHKFFNDRL